MPWVIWHLPRGCRCDTGLAGALCPSGGGMRGSRRSLGCQRWARCCGTVPWPLKELLWQEDDPPSKFSNGLLLKVGSCSYQSNGNNTNIWLLTHPFQSACLCGFCEGDWIAPLILQRHRSPSDLFKISNQQRQGMGELRSAEATFVVKRWPFIWHRLYWHRRVSPYKISR